MRADRMYAHGRSGARLQAPKPLPRLHFGPLTEGARTPNQGGTVAKATALAALIVALLAGCSSGTAKPPVTTAAATPPVPVPTTPTTAASTKETPQCASEVGKPTSEVVGDGGPGCITGATVAADSTGWGKQACADTSTGAEVTVYFWVSSKPDAADTQEYVARSDGDVKVLADATSTRPAILAQVLTAVDCV